MARLKSGTTIGNRDVMGAIDSKTNKFVANIGNGSATEFTLTHNLGTKDIAVGLEEVATGEMVYADIIKTSVNAIKILFGQAPTNNQYRATVVG